MTFCTPRLIAAAACLAACGVVLVAGPLTPPPGPVQSTQLALDDVEPRTPLTSEFVAGDANSVFRITAPGHYYLTGDVVVPSGQTGIVIAGNQVILDLNGYSVRALPGSNDGITTSGTRSDLVIRNGFINAAQVGIRLTGSSRRVLIEDITINGAGGNGIDTSADVTIRNCTVIASNNALDLAGRVIVENCNLTGAVDGIRGGSRMTIRNNYIQATSSGSGFGIQIEGDSVVEGNTVFVNNGNGIRALDGSKITNNTLEGGSSSTGIIGPGSVTAGNTVGGFSIGISQSGGRVSGNFVSATATAGIIASNATVEANAVNIEGGSGIQAQANCNIANNTVTDGDTLGSIGILVTGSNTTVDGNTLIGLGTGVSVNSARSAIVRSNTAQGVADAFGSVVTPGNILAPVELYTPASSTVVSNSPYANFDYQP
ncbi:MAG: right-handed parallel beta-helix repeat-containing protein [Planctomycetota bacterium]